MISLTDYVMLLWLLGILARRFLVNHLPSGLLFNMFQHLNTILMLGGISNIFVIAINFGMPVKGMVNQGGIHIPMADDTLLPILGDYFRLTIGSQSVMYSIGDVLIIFASVVISVLAVLTLIGTNRKLKAGIYAARY